MKTIKDWVERLHRKTDQLFHLLTSVEARLEAIEAGILVPFSLQDSRSDLPSTNSIDKTPHQSLTQTMPLTSASTSTARTGSGSQSTTVRLLQYSQPESSTLTTTQSTPIRPTHHPRTLPSISPIVSSLSSETAINLKESRKKSTTRKKYTRKCLEEFFTQDELAASNLGGSAGKQKLDDYKIGLINRKYCQINIMIDPAKNIKDNLFLLI